MSVTDPHGQITTYHDNDTVSQGPKDANGNPTTVGAHSVYGPGGQLVLTGQYTGTHVSLATAADGNATGTISAQGTLVSTAETVYDADGRAAWTTGPHAPGQAAPATHTLYDADGRATGTERYAGTLITADDTGSDVTATGTLGTATATAYNAKGQRASATDALGQDTTYTYDPYGRLATVALPGVPDPAQQDSKPARPVYTYTYDGQGNLTADTDPLGHTTSYAYDAFGRKTKETLPTVTAPDGSTTVTPARTWNYNALGQLHQTTGFDGDTTTSTYDPEGRLAEQDIVSGTSGSDPSARTITYTYDQYTSTDGSYSNTVTVTDTHPGGTTSTTTTTSTYDRHGNLVEVTSPQGTLHYKYDDATGLKTRAWTGTDPNDPTTDLHYGYDPFGRLASVTTVSLDGAAVNLATLYTYNPDGTLHTTTRPNGTVETRSYDGLGRLTEVATTLGTTTLASFTYSLGKDGRRRTETDLDGRTATYSYDHDGRLVSAAVTGDPNAPDRTYTYSYDLAGNRVEMADTGAPAGQATLYSLYDADGRLSETADQPFQDGGQPYTETFTYDKAGATLADTTTTYDGYGTVLGTQTTTDTWDLQGRLVGTQTPTDTVTDTYDADGHRTSQTTGTTTTKYLNDPTLAYDQVLEEYAPGGVRLATYVRGLDLLFQDRSGVPSYYVHDGLGSTRALTNASGAVTDTYTYGPYGSLTATGTTVNPYLYAGQRRDATGGYVMGSRTYDVSAARFTSRDSYDGSTDDPITQNHYLYVNADPANRTDPSGHISLGSLNVSIGTGLKMYTIGVATLGSIFTLGSYLTLGTGLNGQVGRLYGFRSALGTLVPCQVSIVG